ncbi:MAG: hypothetical protein F4Y27_12700 [Acidimicrobiaceae bacterium]|nr:hypothetical protein [Acidimicrobiaceae bacterium]MXW62879.1 hypothetical protein [Acidimicrobiaceae bacterium]MXW76408.1 hypothetical protein [Acidimicrobiaceae bacterium]MYA75522.1 hypothetical protein [Acidimicrobiaceae bacterium]MYC43904.1 hypothetical protein [Acidimicrobiaceae bacterium]
MLSDQQTATYLGSTPRLRDSRNDRGTVLLMFPAALLIMVILGAIAIDVGYTTVRGRELRAVAASAANDSLAALDIAVLRTTGNVVIDESAARGIVAQAIALGPLPDAQLVDIDINGFEIAVTLRLDIELVMAPALGNLKQVTLIRTERAIVLT